MPPVKKKSSLFYDAAPLCELNITPLVDLLLVILIVFLIASPAQEQALAIQLPEAQGKKIAEAREPSTLFFDKNENLFLDDKKTTLLQLKVDIQKMITQNPQQTLVIQADRGLSYGKVIGVMSLIQEAGLSQVSLATTQP